MELDEKLLRPYLRRRPGVYSYIAKNRELESWLFEKFGRQGLCLKIFGSDYWGLNPLRGCTIIQNLFARNGLAPRVYALLPLPDGRFAQVTDYVSGRRGGAFDTKSVRRLNAEYSIKNNWDMNKSNWIEGLMVDFQGYHFHDIQRYEEEIVGRAYKYAAWGSREEPYMGLDLWNIEGQRDHQKRSEVMKLEDIDFSGKSVLDIGCNLGRFCQDAHFWGAKRVAGVDLPEVADLAFEIANIEGYWNVDFIGANLPSERDRIEGEFDIVFVLSAMQTKPFPWAFELCKEVLYFEGHVPSQPETYIPELEPHFSVIEYLGMTRDHGPRPVLRCWK